MTDWIVPALLVANLLLLVWLAARRPDAEPKVSGVMTDDPKSPPAN